MAKTRKRKQQMIGAALAKLRWKKTTKAERSAVASKLGRKRWAGIPKSKRGSLMPVSSGRPRVFPRCPRYGAHRFSPKTGRCPCGFVRGL
jgi:hypothetical protein